MLAVCTDTASSGAAGGAGTGLRAASDRAVAVADRQPRRYRRRGWSLRRRWCGRRAQHRVGGAGAKIIILTYTPIVGTLAATQANQTVSAAGVLARSPARWRTEANDTISAARLRSATTLNLTVLYS